MYQYFLVKGSERVFLFESQFQFLTEDASLSHYEKGLAKGLFGFDRARINQVWSQLGLWGLIGRICPVELVRVLCAFGCDLQVSDGSETQPLLKSFQPVTYFIPIRNEDLQDLRHLYHVPLDPHSAEHIPTLLELDGRLVIGSFYVGVGSDVDSQLPDYCELLDRDLCLPRHSIRRSLRHFFDREFRIEAQVKNASVTLAHWDQRNEIIRGFKLDRTLFYLGILEAA